MNLLKCYGLIVIGNDLIDWILDDFVRNNDFEINWFNWCIGCENIEIVKYHCWKSRQYDLEVEDDEISFWSLKFRYLQFSPWTLKKCRLVLGA